MKPEFIRTSLKRMWLEDMDAFVKNYMDGESMEVLKGLIDFEADFKSLQVIYNSLGSRDSSNIAKVILLRKQLCPLLGNLYPD